jgi:pyridoxal phosphate enzyme (YggS family)
LFSDNYKTILKRMGAAAERSGRKADSVRLLAVSKTVVADRIREAAEAGCRIFGENKMQEALEKMDALQDLDLEWHFIGHLQKNKVKYVPGRFALVHSVDSAELAEKIHHVSQDHGVVTPILVQVNVSGEASKFGMDPGKLDTVIERIQALDGIRVEGMMTIPPFTEDPEQARPHFSALRRLLEEVNVRHGMEMKELSMGMSHDFEVAVEEGATWVRVGTELFGARQG